MSLLSEWGSYFPTLLDGLEVSLQVTAVSLLVGLPIGLFIALTVSASGFTRLISLIFVEFGRGIPTIVLLDFVYFAGPQAGFTFTAFVSSVVALAFATAAYTSEIFRGAFNSVPHGQVEAAHALCLGYFSTFRHVIFPQGLRVAIPPLMGFAILLFQATSLAYTVTVPELTSQAYAIGAVNFKYLDVLVLAGLMYAAIAIPASRLTGILERSLGRHLQD
jgi:polar amino acid transport system permease protein